MEKAYLPFKHMAEYFETVEEECIKFDKNLKATLSSDGLEKQEEKVKMYEGRMGIQLLNREKNTKNLM